MKKKYTDKQINELSMFLAAGHTSKEASKKFGMSSSYIHQMKKRSKKNSSTTYKTQTKAEIADNQIDFNSKNLLQIQTGKKFQIENSPIGLATNSIYKKDNSTAFGTPDNDLKYRMAKQEIDSLLVHDLRMINAELEGKIKTLFRVIDVLNSRF